MDDNTDPTWNKILRDAEKAGYRDGVGEGKSSVFQQDFDRGYEDGFRNAYKLGLIKGGLRGNAKVIEDPDLERTRKGNCVLCKDPSLEHKTLAELTRIQEDGTKNLIQKLHSTHAKDCIIPLESEVV